MDLNKISEHLIKLLLPKHLLVLLIIILAYMLIICLVLLFGPNIIIEVLRLDLFINKYYEWISFSFLSSIILLLICFTYFILKKIGSLVILKNKQYQLHNLNNEEKIILYSLYNHRGIPSHDSYRNYERVLISKNIISNNIGGLKIQNWAFNYLREHEELINQTF